MPRFRHPPFRMQLFRAHRSWGVMSQGRHRPVARTFSAKPAASGGVGLYRVHQPPNNRDIACGRDAVCHRGLFLTSHLSPLTSHLKHQASGMLAVAQIRPTAHVRRRGLGTTREDVWAADVLCQGDAGARVASGWQRAASSEQRAAGGYFVAGTPVASGSDLAPNLPWPEL